METRKLILALLNKLIFYIEYIIGIWNALFSLIEYSENFLCLELVRKKKKEKCEKTWICPAGKSSIFRLVGVVSYFTIPICKKKIWRT